MITWVMVTNGYAKATICSEPEVTTPSEIAKATCHEEHNKGNECEVGQSESKGFD